MAVTLICPECEQEFQVPPSHVARRRYCSRICLREVLNRDTRPRHKAPWLKEVNEKRRRLRIRDRSEEHRIKKAFLAKGDYDKLLTQQNGKCAICRLPQIPDGNGPRRLCIDHDHTTGIVRGLLCNPCNLALGLFRDDTDVLRAALDYLGETQ